MPAPVVESVLAKMRQLEVQQEEITALVEKLDADLNSLDKEIKALPMQDLEAADRKALIDASIALITKGLRKAAERSIARNATPAAPAPTGGFPRIS
jgi:peptidoglycan hydrolase CwlO-like protein